MPTPTPAIKDAIMTYYDFVLQQVGSINPARKFGGIVQAEAFPPPNVLCSAFYLSVINSFPVPNMGTIENPFYRHVLQWQWDITGTLLQENQQGQNRANRFLDDQTMRDELLRANYPQFCPMMVLSYGSGTLVRTPYVPAQNCRWTQLSFGPRPSVGDSGSGVLYGAAAVDVYAYQQPLSQ